MPVIKYGTLIGVFREVAEGGGKKKKTLSPLNCKQQFYELKYNKWICYNAFTLLMVGSYFRC